MQKQGKTSKFQNLVTRSAFSGIMQASNFCNHFVPTMKNNGDMKNIKPIWQENEAAEELSKHNTIQLGAFFTRSNEQNTSFITALITVNNGTDQILCLF